MVGAGEQAPSFSLQTSDGGTFTDADLGGKLTIMVFYPFAFSPVCTDQLSVYEEVVGELRERGAELYGVSCDSTWAQKAFKAKLGVSIEQLSDWEPKGATCAALGVLHEGGFPQRALIAFGPDASVAWAHMATSPAELPGVNLLFDALEAATVV